MDTAMDVVSVVLFIVLIMYAAIKLDEAARKLRNEEERIYGERKLRYYKVDNDSADGDRTGGMGNTGK